MIWPDTQNLAQGILYVARISDDLSGQPPGHFVVRLAFEDRLQKLERCRPLPRSEHSIDLLELIFCVLIHRRNPRIGD
jgi:hypothetical protein